MEVNNADVAERLRQFDPRALSASTDPQSTLAEFRSGCPVGHSDAHGGFWNLFSYRDVCAAAVDAATFSSRDNTIPSENLPHTPKPIMADPPEHMQYRHPFLKLFAPQAVAPLEPAIRDKVSQLIDGFIEDGAADLARDLFIPFPAFAALQLLGLPIEDLPRFSKWARQMFVLEEGEAHTAMGLELVEYFSALYDALEGRCDESLLGIARNLVVNGETIEKLDFCMMMTNFLTAGLDTTATASSQIALLLDEQRHLRDALLADPGLVPSAIEEMLRYATPLPMLARITNKDVEFSGQRIPKGEKIALHWMAANHDPAEFSEPGRVILDRTPNRHLAFGLGPHRCMGLHLARLELRIVVEEMLARIPDYQVDRKAVQRDMGVTRQVQKLPVSFTPGPRRKQR